MISISWQKDLSLLTGGRQKTITLTVRRVSEGQSRDETGGTSEPFQNGHGLVFIRWEPYDQVENPRLTHTPRADGRKAVCRCGKGGWAGWKAMEKPVFGITINSIICHCFGNDNDNGNGYFSSTDFTSNEIMMVIIIVYFDNHCWWEPAILFYGDWL